MSRGKKGFVLLELKYPAQCAHCSRKIDRKTKAFWSNQSGAVVHRKCFDSYEANRRRAAKALLIEENTSEASRASARWFDLE